jgi:hypothetical protein
MNRPCIHLATLLIVAIVTAAALGSNVVIRDEQRPPRFEPGGLTYNTRGFPFDFEEWCSDAGEKYHYFRTSMLAANIIVYSLS